MVLLGAAWLVIIATILPEGWWLGFSDISRGSVLMMATNAQFNDYVGYKVLHS